MNNLEVKLQRDPSPAQSKKPKDDALPLPYGFGHRDKEAEQDRPEIRIEVCEDPRPISLGEFLRLEALELKGRRMGKYAEIKEAINELHPRTQLHLTFMDKNADGESVRNMVRKTYGNKVELKRTGEQSFIIRYRHDTTATNQS